jgi:hypothetical protein
VEKHLCSSKEIMIPDASLHRCIRKRDVRCQVHTIIFIPWNDRMGSSKHGSGAAGLPTSDLSWPGTRGASVQRSKAVL